MRYVLNKLILMHNLISNTFSIDGNSAQITLSVIKLQKKFKKMSSNNARGDISRAGIINHSLPLLRALLEHGYYSREGLILGNTVVSYLRVTFTYRKKS